MTLFERLTQIFTKDATKYAHVLIPRDHVENPGYPELELEAGKHYFRLWLNEMFLKKEVDWFRSWHPVAHSLVVFQFGDQKIEIPHVAGPSHIANLDEGHLENVIQLDHAMTTLMPFDGGLVEVVVALVAMKGKDFVAAVTKVLGDLSKLLMAPQLSSSLSIAMPIASGIQDLLGGESGAIHLGIHQSFTGKGGGGGILQNGYIAVVRGDPKVYSKERLWVKGNRLHMGDSLAKAELLTGVTHMLFRLEGQTERDDWRGLKTISDSFAEALKALSESDEDKAKDAFRRTLLLVRMSPDLTRSHRSLVASALKEEFEEARKQGFGAVPMSARSLEDVVKRRATPGALLSDVQLETLFSEDD
jgi:hypothetical protein